VTIVEHFDDALRRTTYDAFVESIRARTGLAGFLMTPDAAFGHQRLGTPVALAELGARDGFSVVVVPPFDLGGRHVRSTEIRGAIATGDLATARALLGRRVAITGEAADRTRGGREVALRFEVPVSLPPAGLYVATIEPAIAPGIPPTRPRGAVARVGEDGTVRVRARQDALVGSGLRVAFIRPG
jgi:riboflavin kinase/FMN adenylyltransferase